MFQILFSVLGRVRDNFSSIIFCPSGGTGKTEEQRVFAHSVTLNRAVFKHARLYQLKGKKKPFLEAASPCPTSPLYFTISCLQSHSHLLSHPLLPSPTTAICLVALTHPCQGSSETTSFHLMDEFHLTEFDLSAAPSFSNTSA